MIKISKRLESIASLIGNGQVVADIGCDHGLLSVYLCQAKKVKKIVAADINANALNNARDNIKKYHLEDMVDVRLGAGLDVITDSDKIDTVVIAGMGAHTIVAILKNNLTKLEKIDHLIIQSNTKVDLIRREVVKLNYMIADELIITDNKKNYIIIKFVRGKRKYSKLELFFGPVLLSKNDDLFRKNNKLELEKLYIIKKLLPKGKILQHYKIDRLIRMYKKIFNRGIKGR